MLQIFSKHDGHVGEKPMWIFGSKLKISLQILAESSSKPFIWYFVVLSNVTIFRGAKLKNRYKLFRR